MVFGTCGPQKKNYDPELRAYHEYHLVRLHLVPPGVRFFPIGKMCKKAHLCPGSMVFFHISFTLTHYLFVESCF